MTAVLASMVVTTPGQVIPGALTPSEFYPNLEVLVNERTFTGALTPERFEFTMTRSLAVRSNVGLGYAIQGDVVYFRTGDAPAVARNLSMTWSGLHQIQFVSEPQSTLTALTIDVRLVKFDDLNNNGQWDSNEQQWDLTPELILSDSLLNSTSRSVSGAKYFAGPVLLEANSSYLIGGSASYNLSNLALGPHEYMQNGAQSFSVDFEPVPEPTTLLAGGTGIVMWFLRRRKAVG